MIEDGASGALFWRFPLMLAAWFLPGWALLRALDWRRDPALAFCFSCVILYNVVIGWSFLAPRLSWNGVAVTLAILTAGCWWWSLRRPAGGPVGATMAPFPRSALWLWPIAALLLLAWKLHLQPLSGPDTVFRWNLLPQLMFTEGGLDFYPPLNLHDHRLYFYVDGFPPLVAAQYWWAYASGQQIRPALTSIVVLAQYASILWLVARAAGQLTSPRGGVLAAALLAVSPVFFWSVQIGQETGFMALAVAAIVATWMATRDDGRWIAVVPVALATQLGILAREYGPAYLLVGLLIGAALGVRRERLLAYGLVTVALASPWYLRSWLATGNPIFPLSPASLFPSPTVLNGILAGYLEQNVLWHQRPGYLVHCATKLAWGAPLVWFGTILALRICRGRAWYWYGAGVLLGLLWFSSIGYTSGGFGYTLRVLAPALVVGAVLTSLWFHSQPGTGSRFSRYALPVLGLCGLAASIVAPSSLWESDLGQLRRELTAVRPVLSLTGGTAALTSNRATELVLSDNAYLHAELLLTRRTVQAVPVWAPEFSFLFDPDAPAGSAVGRLAAHGITAVGVFAGGPNAAFLQRQQFFGRELPRIAITTEPHGFPLHRLPPATTNPPDARP